MTNILDLPEIYRTGTDVVVEPDGSFTLKCGSRQVSIIPRGQFTYGLQLLPNSVIETVFAIDTQELAQKINGFLDGDSDYEIF